ncbi:MAG: glycosyltransferase family protein [Patescibacteria group bacterium]
MEKVGIIIQARMSSTRLPGKVLLPLAGKEMLWHVVERCRRSRRAHNVIVATSSDRSDDVLAGWCKKNSIPVFRGNLDNVLSRYFNCAKKNNLDIIVRITSDCPLVDPSSIDEILRVLNTGRTKHVEYVSNLLDRNYPRGLDCEAFTFSVLKNAHKKAIDAFDKEHVTPYIIKNARTCPYTMPKKLQGNYRLTVDEKNDYKLIKLIYDNFYKNGDIINVCDVLKFLSKNKRVAIINKNVKQKDKERQKQIVEAAKQKLLF